MTKRPVFPAVVAILALVVSGTALAAAGPAQPLPADAGAPSSPPGVVGDGCGPDQSPLHGTVDDRFLEPEPKLTLQRKCSTECTDGTTVTCYGQTCSVEWRCYVTCDGVIYRCNSACP